MQEDIKYALEACDLQKNCGDCSKEYKGFKGNKPLTPCNTIRRKYGVAIHDFRNVKMAKEWED